MERATTACRSSLLALVAFGLVGLAPAAYAQGAGGGNAAPPTVVVAPVVNKAVAAESQFTGRIQAIQSVDVQARVEGYLEEVAFQEGTNVKTGDLLYQIEQGPYQASLAQAEAQLASAKAQLSSATANLNNAEINLQRQQTLVQRDTVSQAVVDDAVAKRDSAKAEVEAANAAIQNAQAQIQTAQLNLSYTTIKAPIDGRLGRTYVTIGNLVSQASGRMATLAQLDPIRVAFSVPDTLYTTLVEQTNMQVDRAGRKLFKPSLQLPNGKTYEEPGEISFISNEVDAATGTITAYADFANPRAVLLPGSFVVVTVAQADTTQEPVIPSSAVIQDRQGDYVFVLNQQNVVEQRRIKLGQRTASEVAVTQGLREGDTIVVQGVQKIRPGQTVKPTTQQSDTAGNASQPLESSDDPGASVTPGNDSMNTLTPDSSSGGSSGASAPASGSGTAPATGSDASGSAPAAGSGAAPATGASTPAPASGSGTAPADPPSAPAGSGASAPSDSSSAAPAGSSGTPAAAPATDSPAPADATNAASGSAAPAADASPAPADSSSATPAQSGNAAPADSASAAPADSAETTTTPADATNPNPTPADNPNASAAPATAPQTDANAPTNEAADTASNTPPVDFNPVGTQNGSPVYNVVPQARPGDGQAASQPASGGN